MGPSHWILNIKEEHMDICSSDHILMGRSPPLLTLFKENNILRCRQKTGQSASLIQQKILNSSNCFYQKAGRKLGLNNAIEKVFHQASHSVDIASGRFGKWYLIRGTTKPIASLNN